MNSGRNISVSNLVRHTYWQRHTNTRARLCFGMTHDKCRFVLFDFNVTVISSWLRKISSIPSILFLVQIWIVFELVLFIRFLFGTICIVLAPKTYWYEMIFCGWVSMIIARYLSTMNLSINKKLHNKLSHCSTWMAMHFSFNVARNMISAFQRFHEMPSNGLIVKFRTNLICNTAYCHFKFDVWHWQNHFHCSTDEHIDGRWFSRNADHREYALICGNLHFTTIYFDCARYEFRDSANNITMDN